MMTSEKIRYIKAVFLAQLEGRLSELREEEQLELLDELSDRIVAKAYKINLSILERGRKREEEQ